MNARSQALAGIVLIGLSTVVGAQDWSQWRGPNRDGAVLGLTPPADWPERLNLKWKVDVGLGHATPLVVGNRVYVFSRVADENETMSALDAASGKVLWQTGYPVQFTVARAAAAHGPGPKSTPAFADGKLFAIGMTGIVTAFDAGTGRHIWQKPAPGVMTEWTSHSFSPLVDGDLVIFHVGGTDQGALTAFDVDTGEIRWSWAGDGPGYGSPMIARLGGTRQVVTMTQERFVGVHTATGALLWERPYTTGYDQNIITPVVYGETLIVSGYQNPLVALAVTNENDRWSTEAVWENTDVSLYMSDAVMVGNTLVGFSHRQSGQFFAVDPRTGRTLWTSEPRQAENAALGTVGEYWFALKDDGELIVARGSATAFDVVRRYPVAASATWAQPVISKAGIFVKDVSSLALWAF